MKRVIKWIAIFLAAAVLLAAAEQGVRNASGRDDLEFILHISRGQEPTFATKFFAFMRGQGVQVDLAGLSYYPSSWGQEGFSKFPETVDSLYERLGLPVFIAEYAYPALDPASVDPQQGKWWNRQIDGYPFSEEGQADFMRDLHAWMIKGDRLAGAVWWTPEEIHPTAMWSALSLFQTGVYQDQQLVSANPRQALFSLDGN